LGWVTPRGPCQPLPCWGSVIWWLSRAPQRAIGAEGLFPMTGSSALPGEDYGSQAGWAGGMPSTQLGAEWPEKIRGSVRSKHARWQPGAGKATPSPWRAGPRADTRAVGCPKAVGRRGAASEQSSRIRARL